MTVAFPLLVLAASLVGAACLQALFFERMAGLVGRNSAWTVLVASAVAADVFLVVGALAE